MCCYNLFIIESESAIYNRIIFNAANKGQLKVATIVTVKQVQFMENKLICW